MDKNTQKRQERYKIAKNRYLTENLSIAKLCKELGLNQHWLSREFKKDKINVENKHNKLKFDNKVFDVIDTEEKAYWLGFLYADGYVSNGKSTNNVELSLKLSDYEHLVKYKEFLKAPNSVKTDTFRCRMAVTNKYFREKLIELGCTNNKSLTLRFPNLEIFKSTDLVKHFIRGYCDGDGCLCIVKNKNTQFSILGTTSFLMEMQRHFPIKKIFKLHKNNYKSESDTYVLSFNGKTAIKIAEFLYENSTIFLDRKMQKFKLFKEFAVSSSNI